MSEFSTPELPLEPIIKLLIVDDDEVDRMIIRRSLRTALVSAEIHMATIGAEALEAVDRHVFDFIFIDFMLPDMNGLELLQTIRAKGVTTPVQIVTSQGDERIAVEAIKTGASDYLPKTLLTPEGISQTIRNAIRLHKIDQERLQTQELLLKTKIYLDTVINGAPIVLWAIDKEGIVTMSRGKGLSLIGKHESQSVGLSIYQIYEDYPNFISGVRKALKGQRATRTNAIGDVWFDTMFLPMRDENDRVTGALGVSYDITERIISQQELEKAKDAALSVAQAKEQFLTNVSHEIRTPMSGILGLTDVLAQSDLTEPQRHMLKAINTSASNLMVIINDLLDFSKIEAGKVSLERIPFDVRLLVNQLLVIMEPLAQENNIALDIHLDEAIPTFVLGDPYRLTQILNNLIGNAIKFTKNGAVTVTVRRLPQSEEEYVLEFTVKDTGIGIHQEKLNAIFEKFTQASTDTTRKFGGTGLGLSISKDLIEAQGGQISVQSEPGKGSCFRFTITYKRVSPAYQVPAPSPAPPVVHQFGHLKDLRVLVAEDNPINQMLVRKVLLDYDITVEVAENGQEALDLLEQETFDLVLMDMQMPEMDGYEAMQQIRRYPDHRNSLPIIALTAHASSPEVGRCLAAGANSYLSKPVKAEKLLQEINKYYPDKQIPTPAAASSPEKTDTLHVNLSFLQDFANGNVEFMVDILQLFIDQTPTLVQELRKASEVGNWPQTRTLAHKIKPSLMLVGIKPIEELNNKIEQTALHRSNTQEIPVMVQQMERMVLGAVSELKNKIGQLKQQV